MVDHHSKSEKKALEKAKQKKKNNGNIRKEILLLSMKKTIKSKSPYKCC